MLKRILEGVMWGSVLICIFHSLAIATSPDECVIVAIKLNVRECPNNSCNIIGTVSQGQRFEVVKQVGEYYLLQSSNGKQGFVHGNYIKVFQNNSGTPSYKYPITSKQALRELVAQIEKFPGAIYYLDPASIGENIDGDNILYANGDLNNDNIEEIAVILYEYYHGGTRADVNLAILSHENGRLKDAELKKIIGDVQSIEIKDGEIQISLLTYGKNDRRCCPSVPNIATYRIGEEIKLQNTQPTPKTNARIPVYRVIDRTDNTSMYMVIDKSKLFPKIILWNYFCKDCWVETIMTLEGLQQDFDIDFWGYIPCLYCEDRFPQNAQKE